MPSDCAICQPKRARYYWYVCACLSQLIPVFGYALGSEPDWVRRRPVSNDYYIGIGVVSKNKAGLDFKQAAKNVALNDLSSEVSVTLSGEFTRKVVEQSGLFEDQVSSYVQSATKAELEGYDLVDTWEDSDNYWVYYRLSRALYKEKRAQKLLAATSLSIELCESAEHYLNLNDATNALRFYLQSLLPIENYLGEPIVVDLRGKRSFLLNHVKTSVQQLLSHLEFNPPELRLATKVGRQLVATDGMYLVLHRDTATNTISKMPLLSKFLKGDGELIGRIETEKNGAVPLSNVRVKSTERNQVLSIQPDLFALLGVDSMSIVLRSILGSFASPRCQIVFSVLEAKVLVESREVNFGVPVLTKYAEPKIKKALSDAGCSFVDRVGDADFIIRVEVQSRKGTEIMGQFTAFADATLSVVDAHSGKELYKNFLPRTNGVHLDYDKAGLRAIENAADRLVTEILPEVARRVIQQ